MNSNTWAALYTRLAGGTALTNALGGTCIYNGQAPEGKEPPYVVFNWQGGGYGHQSRHVDASGVIYIRAYSQTSAAHAGTINGLVFNLLDRLPLTITGWTNPALWCEAPHIELAMTDEAGVTTWSSGDTYRVLLDRN